MINLFGLKINFTTQGPYSPSWWGIKFEHGEDTIGRSGNKYWATLRLGLGKRWAWDGYQKGWITHIHGLGFQWGKFIPLESEFDEEYIE